MHYGRLTGLVDAAGQQSSGCGRCNPE